MLYPNGYSFKRKGFKKIQNEDMWIKKNRSLERREEEEEDDDDFKKEKLTITQP